jgi:Ca2+/Na+ antiporter
MEDILWKIVGIFSTLFFAFYLYRLYKKYYSWYDSLSWIVKIFTPNPREDTGFRNLLLFAFVLVIVAIAIEFI